MIDPHAKLINYLRLMLLIVILGAVSAVITFVFIALVNLLIDFVWEGNPTRPRVGCTLIHIAGLYTWWSAGGVDGEALRRS